MCPLTDTWLETHTVHEGGVDKIRQKGDKVPKTLLQSWRKCRKNHPHLFRGNLIWGSKNAYQNEANCVDHSQLIEEEMGGPCIHLVDMFAGELAPSVEEANFKRGQIKATVPPKQTSLTQVVDLGLGVRGKRASNMTKQKQRRNMRRKAQEEGVASKLEAGCYEIMELLNSMHDACVEAAEEGEVARLFRKGGWFAVEAGKTSLQKAEGKRWAALPLGGTQIPRAYLEDRFAHFDSNWIPARPDWSKLHKLRMEQREKAITKVDEKKKGAMKAVLASLLPESPAAKRQKRNEEDEKEFAAEEKSQSEKDSTLAFTQLYMTQASYEMDSKTKEGDEEEPAIDFSLSEIAEMEVCPESLWMSMHPKRRRDILANAQLSATTTQVPFALRRQEELRVALD